MNYEDFKKELVSMVSKHFDASTSVTIKTIEKNNGTKKDALFINEKDHHISPTIYLEGVFDDYKSNMDMDITVTKLINIYHANSFAAGKYLTEIDAFEKCKPYIISKVINYDKNLSLLADVPHERFMDLAIIYLIIADMIPTGLSFGPESRGFITIRNFMLEKWNVTKEDIRDLSISNTPKLMPYEVQSMSDFIGKLSDNRPLACEVPMYILTNKYTTFGASAMLYTDVLKAVSDKLNSDLYIIPSSIHELIFIPKDNSLISRKEDINTLIRTVNKTEVDPEDILSDHVYIYERNTNQLTY